jgi:hypothetical protein
MPKAAKAKSTKKSEPRKSYVLPVKFNEEELRRLEAVEDRRGLRRGTLLKSLLKDEANRLNIP